MRGIVAPSRPLSFNTSTAAFKRRSSDSRLRDCFTLNGFFAIDLPHPLLSQISKIRLTKCKCEFTFASRECESEFTLYFISAKGNSLWLPWSKIRKKLQKGFRRVWPDLKIRLAFH